MYVSVRRRRAGELLLQRRIFVARLSVRRVSKSSRIVFNLRPRARTYIAHIRLPGLCVYTYVARRSHVINYYLGSDLGET